MGARSAIQSDITNVMSEKPGDDISPYDHLLLCHGITHIDAHTQLVASDGVFANFRGFSAHDGRQSGEADVMEAITADQGSMANSYDSDQQSTKCTCIM